MEPNLIPYTASTHITARSVLVLAPHPDDEVFGCGGAIASHVARGIPVKVLVLTDGANGGTAEKREQESIEAARLLGYGKPMFWRLPDRGLLYTDVLVRQILQVIQESKVDLVYAPSPWEVHPDHRQTCEITIEVVRRAGSPVRLAFYEVGTPLRPNLLLDISSTSQQKQHAMTCFSSQLAHQDYLRHINALNVYRTYTLGREVTAAEAYWVVTASDLANGLAQSLVWMVSSGLARLTETDTLDTQHPPLVSILIRSMDRPHLAQALDSVSIQTYPNIEIVIIAACVGHSPMPDRWGPFKLRLVETTTPLMRSHAANRAFEAARGSLLILLDDDDWLMPDHVARLAAVLKRLPQVLAAYTGVALVDADNRPLGQVFDLPFDGVRLKAGNMMPIHGVMFRNEVIRRGLRFDETLDRYEDWDFWLQLGRHSCMAHLPGISAVYRIHTSSGVHQNGGAESADSQAIYEKWRKQYSKQDIVALMQRVWAHNELHDELTDLRENKQNYAESMLLLSSIQRELTELSSSRSWKITHPLRLLSTQVRHLRQSRLVSRLLRVKDICLKEGVHGIWFRLRQPGGMLTKHQPTYEEWAATIDTPAQMNLAGLKAQAGQWKQQPLISVVMPVYNPPLSFLREAVESLKAQTYENWELCVADDASTNQAVWDTLIKLAQEDPRIHCVRRKENGHISRASNTALELVRGDFVALVDNDDILPPHALHWVAETINQNPDVQIIYSDEDKLDEKGRRFGAYLKPDWNYTLFLGHNLISHLGVYRTDLVRSVGGFRIGFEGSQDYDLALRCIERIQPEQIAHISKVLYHWRAIEGSTAMRTDAKPYAVEAARRALIEHRERIGLTCTVEVLPTWNYRCIRPSSDVLSDVSVVVYGSQTESAWMCEYRSPVLEVLRCGEEPNEWRKAVSQARGSLIALIRSDLKPMDWQSLTVLAAHTRESMTGVAAGSIRDTSGRLISGGLVVNGEYATVLLHGLPDGQPGYMGRGLLDQELTAVCLNAAVISRQAFESVGGLNALLGLKTADAVDFCQSLRSKGFRVVWCPVATWKTTRNYNPSAARSQVGSTSTLYDPHYPRLMDSKSGQFNLHPAPADSYADLNA